MTFSTWRSWKYYVEPVPGVHIKINVPYQLADIITALCGDMQLTWFVHTESCRVRWSLFGINVKAKSFDLALWVYICSYPTFPYRYTSWKHFCSSFCGFLSLPCSNSFPFLLLIHHLTPYMCWRLMLNSTPTECTVSICLYRGQTCEVNKQTPGW